MEGNYPLSLYRYPELALLLSSYTQALKDPITALLAELQPQAIAFNGYGLTPNPARWIASEMGVAPDPNWSTGTADGSGDPDSPVFCPSECDTTLQQNDRWFWVRRTHLCAILFMFDCCCRVERLRFVLCPNLLKSIIKRWVETVCSCLISHRIEPV
jgi:hypothetical protein